MSFINAILHANIGYGIRRSCWMAYDLLHLNQDKLEWVEKDPLRPIPIGEKWLTLEDYLASDWEIV